MKKIVRLSLAAVNFVAWLLHIKASYRCGHRGKRRFKITLFGANLGRYSDPDFDRDHCSVCLLHELEKTSIRCADAACGRPILIGDAVCVITPDPERKIAGWAHRRGESVVLCSCCGSGADYTGNWGHGRYALTASAA